MSRRRTYVKGRKLVSNTIRYTSTENYVAVGSDWEKFDLFLIGGGGSGGGWNTWGYGPGGGGAGGECVTIKDLTAAPGTLILVTNGSGGVGIPNKQNTAGNEGSPTTVVIGQAVTYTARGGAGGGACISSSDPKTATWAPGAKGWDSRSDAIGLVSTGTTNVFDVHDKSGNVILRGINTATYTSSNPCYINRGIPEFDEPNGITHAAGGATANCILPYTQLSNNVNSGNGRDYKSSSAADDVWIRGGGGYGGGGAGAYYRDGISGSGGNGATFIRYWYYTYV